MSTQITTLPGCHSQVADEFAKGRPILIVARNSSQGSNDGRRLVANDALEAVWSLAAAGVIDVRDLIPSRDQIVAGPTTSEETVVLPAGRWTY